jgi:hypothetical protein
LAGQPESACGLDALEQALHDRRPASRGSLVHQAIAAPNMFRSNTPSGSPKPESNLL